MMPGVRDDARRVESKTGRSCQVGAGENSPALEASCLRGALPPVDLRAVCLVRAIVDDERVVDGGVVGCECCRVGV